MEFSLSIDSEFEAALLHHQRGDVAQAEAAYRAILTAAPDYFRASHMLGIIAFQHGDAVEAERSISTAIRLNPEYAEAHNDLGLVLLGAGRGYEAIASFDRALNLNSDFLVAAFQRAGILLAMGRMTEAVAGFEHVLRLRSDIPEAWTNRGHALLALGRHTLAFESLEQAIKLNPDFVPALGNRGAALLELRRPAEALADFDRALALQPGMPELLTNRGNALAALRRYSEAVLSFDQALAARPDFPGALDGRGEALRALNRPEEAAVSFLALMRVAPEYPDVVGNLFTARLHCCDWSDYEALSQRIVKEAQEGRQNQTPFSFILHSTSPADQKASAESYIAAKVPPKAPLLQGEVYAHERIRVAYLSSDFNEHVVADVSARLYELHYRARFEVYAFSFSAGDGSPMRARLERSFDSFIDVTTTSDAEVAAMLRHMQIDIAVDLNGHTNGARTGIFAHRPCPVQVNYLGYPATMGAPYIDYILGDSTVIKPGEDDFYTEKVVRLPETFFVTDDTLADDTRTPPRHELGLPVEGFVFACFSGPSKITPAVFAIWMRLLQRAEASVLWLRGDAPAVTLNLRAEAERQGIDPARLIFAERTDLARHLARQRAADLFLDTVPYNAHGTAIHTLWAGMPLVTCEGETFAGRVAASLLKAMRLPELIAASPQDYETLAYKLAITPGLLTGLRAKVLANRRSTPLFDTQAYCRDIERSYISMWERSQRGEFPSGIDDAPESVRP